MKTRFPFYTLFFLGTLVGCTSTPTQPTATEETVKPQTELKQRTKGDTIIDQAIEAHGGQHYRSADYSFTFRDRSYRFINQGSAFTYTLQKQKGDTIVIDSLVNGNLTRNINGSSIQLSKKEQERYSGSINSVIYFATLPDKLNDGAVNKKYVDTLRIKGQLYDVVLITFDQEGGGKDFEDQYYYWINAQTHRMEYLAYNYKENGGGVRFRSAYNPRNVDGIIFQDYINYKAPVGTPLSELPALYEQDQLVELSRIETENVVHN